MMIVTKLKIGFQKLKPQIVVYRDYKHFDNENFWLDIQSCASENNMKCFKETVFCIFNKHAPTKRKYVRANEAPFTTKELHKTIMKRSSLRNKLLKAFKWKYCKRLLRSIKKSYFNNIDISKINDNRSFRKILQKAKRLTWLKKVKLSQKMLNYVVFSIIIFQKSLPISKY